MTYIPEALRREVELRATGRCEYCRIHEDDRYYAHEIDHIYAEKHGGGTESSNLCLACDECNRYKGSDICSLDRETGQVVALYHPRRDVWADHFELNDSQIKPKTATGRVTARLLHFNDSATVKRRRMLIEAGRFPLE